jgi:UDP-2-acetamido-2-deoxy-ribo-hexuluronate aminotransferase
MERFEPEVDRRLAIGGRYSKLIDQLGISRVRVRPDRTTVYAQYTVAVDYRDKIVAALKMAGVPTAVHYPVPLNEQPAYKGLCGGAATPESVAMAKRVMSLPMGPDLSGDDQDRIAGALRAAVLA